MKRSVEVSIKPDKNGFTGRECPKCENYFKVKFGTGLPITYQICPYCGYQGDSKEFFTKEQIEYAKSIAIKELVAPILDEFHKSLKQLETTKRGFIQIKIQSSGNKFKVYDYQEKMLETEVLCDNCGLQFSIYGVFCNCPDCGKLNVRVIFERSIAVLKNKLKLYDDSNIDSLIREDLLKDSLSGAISAFDSLGKALRTKYANKFPFQPRNLFQNFIELDKVLKSSFGKNIKDYLSQSDSEFLFKMFQIRHIYEHNAGVIDTDFISKLPSFAPYINRKYLLQKEEVQNFLDKLLSLMQKIYSEVE